MDEATLVQSLSNVTPAWRPADGSTALGGAVHTRAERPLAFSIRLVDTDEARGTAQHLIDRMYATRGYRAAPSTKAAVQPRPSHERRAFMAVEAGVAVGTISVVDDSDAGLAADELFADEVARMRATGLGVCEFGKLAMDRRARSPKLLASLFHVAYLEAYRVNRRRYVLIEVNPRHVRYYQAMLGFDVVGPTRLNLRVNAPAVLMCLDLAEAERQIALQAGRVRDDQIGRSAYPYFFDAQTEAGVLGKLWSQGRDLVTVDELNDDTHRLLGATAVCH